MSTEKTFYVGRAHLVDKFMNPYKSKDGLRQAYDVSFKNTKGELQQGGIIVGLPNQYPVQIGNLYSYTVHLNDNNNHVVTITARPADEALPLVEQGIGNVGGGVNRQDDIVKPVADTEPKPQPVTIPDTQPRKGFVSDMERLDPWVKSATETLYKTKVSFSDGAIGIMWSEKQELPFAKGEEINYTFGKIYGNGDKRIDLVPEGSSVDKETMIMRMGCNNTAIAFMALDQNRKWTIEEMFKISEQIQTNVLRSK